MKIGIFYGTTDYAPLPHEVAAACEERGFESFWVPEHTHIPASRSTPYPGGGELPEHYYHLHDPFVSLASAAVATRRIKLGTAVCLVGEHDPIVLAKQVASLDLLSNGRVIFGIGAGWNREEMLNHGTDPSRRWKVVRERVEAMKRIWADDEASYHGEFVNFERIWCWPKPVQRPHPPILLGSATERGRQRVVRYCDGWLPFATPNLAAEIGDLRSRARDADRDPGSIPVSLLSPRPREDDLRRYRDMGVERAILLALPAAMDELLPRFDRYAKLIQKLES
jgi:probable F420-dependent oxidoreductase